jgi:hypothetical protein
MSDVPSLTGRLEIRRNEAERRLQLRTDEINGRNDRNTDAGRDQSILYGRCSGFILNEFKEPIHACSFFSRLTLC